MRNTGYSIAIKNDGYHVEYFTMNSQTFEVSIIETRGPFDTYGKAEDAQQSMRTEHDHTGN